MPDSNAAQLKRIATQLDRGETPRLRTYIPGARELVERYNRQHDVFVPPPHYKELSQQQRRAIRAAFRARAYYRRHTPNAEPRVARTATDEDILNVLENVQHG